MCAHEVNNSCFVVIYTDLHLSFTPLLQADASLCRNMVFFQLHYQMLHLLGLLYPQKREQNWRSHQQGSTSLGMQNAVAYAVCRQIAQGSRQIGIRLWTSRSLLAAGSKLNTTSRGECMRGQMLKGCFILNIYTDSLRFISPNNTYCIYFTTYLCMNIVKSSPWNLTPLNKTYYTGFGVVSKHEQLHKCRLTWIGYNSIAKSYYTEGLMFRPRLLFSSAPCWHVVCNDNTMSSSICSVDDIQHHFYYFLIISLFVLFSWEVKFLK